MKYSFALAVLLAVVSQEAVQAIQISAEPVMKKEEPKKDEAAIKAKFEAKAAEKKAQDDKAKDAETKNMNDAEQKKDEEKAAYQTQYWANVKEQTDETKRIQDLRVRPAASAPMEGHDKKGPASAGEHWTANMPDHILDNQKGPTAPFDSPKPPVAPAVAAPAPESEKK